MKAKFEPKNRPEVALTSAPPVKPRAGNAGNVSRYVGLGASAGGLEAMEQFFTHLPVDTGMAFIVVQHLDPTQKGLLPELVQRCTKMMVFQVKDEMKVRPDCVYVIPPNKDMAILHGTLHLLVPAAPRGLRLPIDFFFRHLADDQGEKAVGIILSGMGTDGTQGLKALKGKLGLVMVQDPGTAKYDGMPRSAIDLNIADFIAPAEELPAKLIAWVQHATVLPKGGASLAGRTLGTLEKVFILLRSHTGYDFSLYKRNTIYRRIERRMGIHQIDKIAQYVRYLQENPQELELLFKELLIGVTNFFRDPAAFDALKEKAVLALLPSRPAGHPFRVWVPGCATGEEAYSLAITLKEAFEQAKLKRNHRIQIFATDIDKDAIERARQGAYMLNIAADVSPERLARFFTKDGSHYRLNKEIRELVVFAPQNVIMDPPFTKLDLISCRNVLIYFTPELQTKLLPLFQYALNPQGILFLGSSESIGTHTDRFSPVDGKWRIYTRRETALAPTGMVDLPSTFLARESGTPAGVAMEPKISGANVQNLADQLLIRLFAPPAVLINDKGDILYFHGRTGKYLEPAAGKANLNVYAMAREGLRYELAGVIHRAITQQRDVTLAGLKVKTNGDYQSLRLVVKLLLEPEVMRGLLLIVFEDVADPLEEAPSPGLKPQSSHRFTGRIAELEKELQQAREHLQTSLEEMQTSQEELKAMNEELQSTNEELQSTNEELTTSKEEMQSLNEELMSVNAELQTKVDEFSRASDDMNNLLNSTHIATLFLDKDLNIRRFTTQAARIFKLIPTDVGRALTDIASYLDYDGLAGDVTEVLQTLAFKEAQVTTKDGRYFTIRIMPYRTSDNLIDGVVVTFVDITTSTLLETSLRESEERFRSVVETIPDAITITDATGRITFANAAAERLLRLPRGEILRRTHHDPAWKITHKDGTPFAEQELPFHRIMASGQPVKNVTFAIQHPDGQRALLSVRATPLRNAQGQIAGMISLITDVAEPGEAL